MMSPVSYFRWLCLPTHLVHFQEWAGCSMGPYVCLEKWGWITCLRKAHKDTKTDQKGYWYAYVKFSDGTNLRRAIFSPSPFTRRILYHDKQNKCFNIHGHGGDFQSF